MKSNNRGIKTVQAFWRQLMTANGNHNNPANKKVITNSGHFVSGCPVLYAVYVTFQPISNLFAGFSPPIMKLNHSYQIKGAWDGNRRNY
jgi:hypothetical protein